MRDLLAYAFHRGEAAAYRNAGMHDKYVSHTRRARYYRSRFGTEPQTDEFGTGPQTDDTTNDVGDLNWGEDASIAYDEPNAKRTIAGITWKKLSAGTTAYLFCTDDTVAKIFKAQTLPQNQAEGFKEDAESAAEVNTKIEADARAEANIKRKKDVEAEVSIMKSVGEDDLVPKFFRYEVHYPTHAD